MCKKLFFRFLVILFLLSLQVFMYAAGAVSSLASDRDEVYNLIDCGKSSQAAAIEDKLIADNSQDPCLPEVISGIAARHAGLRCYDYGKAKTLYNRLIQLYPKGDCAAQARLEISKIDIFAKMEAGSLKSASDDVEQLIANNSKNPHLSKVLFNIADRYAKRNYFKQAGALYQRLIKLCPADSFTDKAKCEQVKNNIFSKLMAGDLAVVDGLLQNAADNYPNRKYLPDLLCFMADKYEENYKYEKAGALHKQILAINPDSRKAALELTKLDIYEKISDGDFTSAQDLTEKLITENSSNSSLPEVLYTIADYYRKCCNYVPAKKLYSRLIGLYPDSSYSSRAHAEMALLDIRAKIAMGTFDPAAGEIEQLKSGYEKDFFLARRCYELGDYCLHGHNYDAAISVLEAVLQQFPQFHYYYGRAKICDDTAKICKEIRNDNLSDAQTALQKFKQDYAGYSYLPGQLYFIARAYSSYGYQDQSSALCNEVIKMGDSKYVAYGNIHKMRLSIQSRLEADDLAGAKQIFNQFKSKYADSLYLEEGIFDLVREFYDKGLRTEGDSSGDYLKEAVAICQAQKPTEASFKIQCYTTLAQSYSRLGNFAESASYYQKIVDEYPDSRFAWNAQFMAGRAYEKMQQAGVLSEQEAAGRIKSAYQNLLEKYPSCQAAKAAQKWLENNHN